MLRLIAVLLLCTTASAQTPRFIQPQGLSKNPAYTHVVEITGGRTLLISGQIALDAQGKLVGAGDFAAQAKQVMDNLGTALRAAGMDYGNVVKLNSYVIEMPKNLPAYRTVRSHYFSGEHVPASTTVGVAALAIDGALLEVEAIAVASSAQSARARIRK